MISTGDEIREIADQLMTEGLVYKNSQEYPTLGVTDKGRKFLNRRERLTLSKPKRVERQRRQRVGSGRVIQ